MRFPRTLALGASILVLLSACSTGGGSKPTIKIGSVAFDEARVMAELYGQVGKDPTKMRTRMTIRMSDTVGPPLRASRSGSSGRFGVGNRVLLSSRPRQRA